MKLKQRNKNNMKKLKEIMYISVIALLLSLVLTSNINAKIISDNPTFEVGYIDQSGNSFYAVIQLNDEQIQKFRDSWCDWENYLKNIREDHDMNLQENKELESRSIILLEEVKNLTRDPNTGQIYFPSNIEIPTFVHSHLFILGFGARIFSIGRGRVWLPFDRQGEAFVGVRFNPIFVSYSIGFTRVSVRSLSILPSCILNRFFVHRVCTAGFTGLYVNFGKLFSDSSVGPVILIGKPLFVTVGSDIF